MKYIEQINLEGNFKLKKVFSVRSQIPVDPSDDELRDMIQPEKNKTEPIIAKLDFNVEVPHVNQVLNYERIKTYINYAKGAIEESQDLKLSKQGSDIIHRNNRFSSHRASDG
jgi:hypothetical protein